MNLVFHFSEDGSEIEFHTYTAREKPNAGAIYVFVFTLTNSFKIPFQKKLTGQNLNIFPHYIKCLENTMEERKCNIIHTDPWIIKNFSCSRFSRVIISLNARS